MNAVVQKTKGSVFLTHTKNEWFTSQSNLQLHHFPSLIYRIYSVPSQSLLWSPRHIPLTVITQYYHIPSGVISATESVEQGSTPSLLSLPVIPQHNGQVPVTCGPLGAQGGQPAPAPSAHWGTPTATQREFPYWVASYRWCPAYCIQVTGFNQEPSLKLNVGRKELLRVCISV